MITVCDIVSKYRPLGELSLTPSNVTASFIESTDVEGYRDLTGFEICFYPIKVSRKIISHNAGQLHFDPLSDDEVDDVKSVIITQRYDTEIAEAIKEVDLELRKHGIDKTKIYEIDDIYAWKATALACLSKARDWVDSDSFYAMAKRLEKFVADMIATIRIDTDSDDDTSDEVATNQIIFWDGNK